MHRAKTRQDRETRVKDWRAAPNMVPTSMFASFLALYFTFFGLAFGQVASQTRSGTALFDSVQSPFFQFQADFAPSVQGEDDLLTPLYRADFLKYEPTGKQKVFSLTCEWQNREPREVKNFAEFSQKWNSYKDECAQTLQNGSTNGLRNFYDVMFTRLRLKEHPRIRQVSMRFPNGTVAHALLGLKDDKPRPMVVFRLGIFSNIDQMYAERYLLMQLFEQSPFHLLAIESMTGSDFVARNKVRSFGGMDEGLQNLHVLKHLREKSEPISRLVSSLHLLGISMGGNGQLFTHIMQALQQSRPWVNSTLLFCPPVNLQETLDYHLNHRFRSLLTNMWARKRLSHLGQEDATLRKDYFLQDLLDKIAKGYTGPIEDASWIRWPTDWSQRKKDFWKGNAFFPLLKDDPTPLLIVATEQDPVVPYLLNSGQIARHQVDLGSAKVLMWTLPEAVHCSLPGAYDWREMASIFQDFVLSQSPEFKRQEQSAVFELDNEIKTEMLKLGFHPRFEILLKENEPSATVRVKFYPQNEVSFFDERSLKTRDFSISLASLDLGFEGTAKLPAEIEMTRRWLHQNLRLDYEKPGRIRMSWKVAAPTDHSI